MGAKARPKLQIDPKLSKALRSAGDEGTVEAVLMFDSPESASAAQQHSDRLKQQLVKAAQDEPIETNYFPNLGSVAVRAKGKVLKELLKQPGLSVAALNRP